jgi:Protein of unknown function (DUF2567)
MTLNPVVAQPRTPLARAAVLVVLGVAVAGAAVGALWALVAPPAHGVVALTKSGERAHAYLGSEADHFFVAAVMMLGMLTVLAVVAAALVWQWRPHRGPVMVGALTIGMALGALAAAGVGTALARMRYGVVDFDTAPVTPEHRVHYFTQAPSVFFGHTPIQMAVGVLVPGAVAALMYALLAVSTVRDDLGGYPPEEPVRLPPPIVTVDGGLPPVR